MPNFYSFFYFWRTEFAQAPDFESPKDANGDNIYEIDAVVSDGQLSDSVSIKIQINDVNELTPLSDFNLPRQILRKIKIREP